MGYIKFIKYSNTIETYVYEKRLSIRPKTRRGISRKIRLSGLVNDTSDKRRQEQFEGKRQDNSRRASMVFRRLVSANLNGVTNPLLLTLTYKDNETSLKTGYKDFGSFIQALRYKFGKQFRYIAVPEFQKRGAVHFHALFWDLPNTIFETERQTRLVAELWGKGYVFMKETDGNQKLSSYLTKYMSKSFVDYRLMNQKAYVRSRNLIKPEIISGISEMGLEILLNDNEVITPEIDKKYNTHRLGEGRHRIYKIN